MMPHAAETSPALRPWGATSVAMNDMKAPPVALIAGPTASGKSGLALALAHSLRAAGREAVIINADASQVYRDIPILSARPMREEMGDVPHRLFGHIDGAVACDAARWASEARAEIAEAHALDAVPILVGGTGLYIDTLLRGIAPVPPIDETLRAAIRALPVREAYRRLQVADPGAASRLKPLDKTRIARALEVMTATGTPLSDWQLRREGGIGGRVTLLPAILLPPRDWLYARCDARLEAMFAGGAIDEVLALSMRQLDPALPVMNAIGVASILEIILSGEYETVRSGSRALALGHAQMATRRYAKRQYTWFRNQSPPDWPRHEGTEDFDIDSEIVIKLRQSLLTE
jgi:tRNA dimethylallyltransferase